MPTRRLKKGVTLEQESADVTRMIPILRAQYGPLSAQRASALDPALVLRGE